MTNLAKRALTGLIAGSALIFAIWVSPYGLLALCVLVSLLGLEEFYTITGVQNKVLKWGNLALAAVLWLVLQYLIDFAPAPGSRWLILIVPMLWVPLSGMLLLFEREEKAPVYTMGKIVLGVFYCYFPFILLYLFAFAYDFDIDTAPVPIGSKMGGDLAEHYLYQLPLGVFFLVWCTDTFAYFGGRFFGKRKLFERISPKKTWAGSLVGGVACVGLAVGFEYFWAVENWNWIAAGALISVTSQYGDLVESMFKRSLDIKDSGSILPGHGGILDRFDGIFFSVPFLFILRMAFLAFA